MVKTFHFNFYSACAVISLFDRKMKYGSLLSLSRNLECFDTKEENWARLLVALMRSRKRGNYGKTNILF